MRLPEKDFETAMKPPPVQKKDFQMSVSNISNDNHDPARICTRCGGYGIVECETTTSIWSGGMPYVIERIPALRCEDCEEILIDRETADRLKRMAQSLPDGHETLRMIEVPVIAFPVARSPLSLESGLPALAEVRR